MNETRGSAMATKDQKPIAAGNSPNKIPARTRKDGCVYRIPHEFTGLTRDTAVLFIH